MCICVRRAHHFNHPSHGAALSHVVTMIARKKNTRVSPFSRKEEDKDKEESPKTPIEYTSRRLSRAAMRRALLFLFVLVLVLTQILLSFYTPETG